MPAASRHYTGLNLLFSLDFDECATDNGGCNRTCTNTEGSFECSCDTGYTLATDNLNCGGMGDCFLL